MTTPFRRLLATLLLSLLGLALGGCSAESRKNRYLAQAEQSFQAGKFDEAEIQYKNVLKLQALQPRAIARLGLIYAEQGRIGQAIPLLVKARELQPDDLDLRIKYAHLCLFVGALKDAATEAGFILERRPQDPEAPLILAAAARPADIAAARQRLQALSPAAAAGAPVLTAFAALDLRTGNPQTAEPLLKQALAADPKFAPAHAALGSLYWMRNDRDAAGQAFRLAAENSPARSPRRIQYAQFRLQTGDTASAKRQLEEMTRATPDYLPAWALLAEIALVEKDFNACNAHLGKILERDNQHLEGLFIQGRLQLAQGDTAKSIETLERLLKIYPRAPRAHYQLGLAHLAAGNASPAAASLRQALAFSPGQPDATLALANLSLRIGDPAAAAALLKPLVQQQPRHPQARLLLAEAHRMLKNFDEALAIYRQFETDFPGNAQNALLTGLLHLQRNQPAEARLAFEQALARAPGLVPALEKLAVLDIAEQKPDDALRRVEAELARSPSSPGLRVLLAKVFIAKKDTARAAAELRETIKLQPENTEAAYLLAQLHLDAGDAPQALANLQAVVEKNPRDIGAWFLAAQIHEQRKDHRAARDAYEKIIAINPRLASAHNNLACLYSDFLNEPDKAHAAAQKARELAPQDPHILDTLAWILFKKGQYRWALTLLEESAAKLSDSPVVQFHLGMARYMLGQEGPARLAFQQALDQNKDFPEIESARQRLALLATDPVNPTPETRPLLEKILASLPADPVALARLAALQEQTGNRAAALATLRKAADANPGTALPLIHLARLHALDKDTARALDAAKAARKAEPDDPGTARTLGRIAYQAGDYTWAAALLQESAGKNPGDPALLHDAALALYASGRIADAETSLQAAAELDSTPNSPARRLLGLIALARSPSPDAAPQIQAALAEDPANTPALMAQGALAESQGDTTAARLAYEKLVAQLPGFTPAKIRIAVLAAAQPGFDAKACELALQARTAAPDDTELARALGLLLLRKGGEAPRAVNLLRQAALARPGDAELHYRLGLAQLQTKDTSGARQSLQKALDAGLPPDLAADARKNLAVPK